MNKSTLPTYKQLTELAPIAEAVIKQMGYSEGEDLDYCISSLQDAANHGASGGFNGFIYYTDTYKFADDNRKAIAEMFKAEAEEYGVGIIEMIQGFNGLKDQNISEQAISIALWGGDIEDQDEDFECDLNTVKNLFSWVALEAIGHALIRAQENDEF